MSDATPTTTAEAPNVPFFKKRAQNRNARKRNLSDDEDQLHASRGALQTSAALDPSTLSSVSKKRSAKRAPQTSHADILLACSNSQLNRPDDPEKTVGVAYKASLEGNVRIDDATRTHEIDTAHDRDAQAVIDRHLRAVENGLEETTADDGLYKGLSGYKSHIAKSENTNSKMRVGPIRASSNIRVTNRFDYQPDICKDYKETGFCGYGDSCIYMHDRGDYKAGWQLDQEWEAEQRAKKMALIEGLDGDKDESSSDDDDEVPFACLICREEFKHPVVTKCGHYFCEKCALKRYAKTPKCFACNAPTGGLFNSVSKDFLKKVAERKLKMEEAAKRREEEDALANGTSSSMTGIAATEEDSGMVEDLSVVGMGGVPQIPDGGSDDDDSDDNSD